MNTFVAMTTSSRLVKSAMARPTISSLEPSEYVFAVSNVVIPASRARRMNGRLSSSGSDQGCVPRNGSPKLMQPRVMAETSRPLEPSLR